MSLHSLKMSFVPLICRCYVFLYIRLPFNTSFWEVPNILFLLLKRRKILDFHRCGIPSYFSFPKQSFIAPHTIISEVCFNNREFILFFWCHSWCHPMLLNVISTFLSIIFHFRSIISALLRKSSLVNAKKCFTNNILCKILITFA